MNSKRTYAAIDLKSFYASVECVERGLDPITTPLVVADPSRGKNTICLAVTPELKKFGERFFVEDCKFIFKQLKTEVA